MARTEQSIREEAFKKLVTLGFFEPGMVSEVTDKLVTDQGNVRYSIWSRWQAESEPIATEIGFPSAAAVPVGLIAKFHIYGVEEVVDHAEEDGVKITFARLLESAFQFALRQGEAYEEAKERNRPEWKATWNILCFSPWNPFA